MAKKQELNNSFFSTVYEIRIHPAHVNFTGLVIEILKTKRTKQTGTQKYEPPETDNERGEIGQPRSRLYDMWSMGCIVFEFIIWLLYSFN